MKKLIEECYSHDYVWLKRETLLATEPKMRAIEKDIYACVKCGSGLDVYDLDQVEEINAAL